jgi:hypothetical protein
MLKLTVDKVCPPPNKYRSFLSFTTQMTRIFGKELFNLREFVKAYPNNTRNRKF